MLKGYIRTGPRSAFVRQYFRRPLLRHSFGESHGPAYGGVVDGCPPGMALAAADIQKELDREAGKLRAMSRSGANPNAIESSPHLRGPHHRTAIGFLIRNEDSARRITRPSRRNSGRTCRLHLSAESKACAMRGRRPRLGGETVIRVAAGAIAKKWLRESYGRAGAAASRAARPHRHPVRKLGRGRRQFRSLRRTRAWSRQLEKQMTSCASPAIRAARASTSSRALSR